MGLSFRTNDANPNPRVACVLALDTSYSMAQPQRGEQSSPLPIDELNDGFALFCEEIKKDDLARKRAEIAVITFGGTARVAIDFTEGRDLQPQRFPADGATPMGAALNLAADELTKQKQAHKAAGLLYYRPWLFLISDGTPTDEDVFEEAAARVRAMEAAHSVNVFSVGVGEDAEMSQLAKISAARPPLKLKGLSFIELFQWLSASMKAVSQSAPPNGAAGELAGQQLSLDPVSAWAQAAL
jgi:uncharacterized protein YegL